MSPKGADDATKALVKEYRSALGHAFNNALDSFGIEPDDWEGHRSVLRNSHQSEAVHQKVLENMRSDPRTLELMSLLGKV
jgi:hypothetical protein